MALSFRNLGGDTEAPIVTIGSGSTILVRTTLSEKPAPVTNTLIIYDGPLKHGDDYIGYDPAVIPLPAIVALRFETARDVEIILGELLSIRDSLLQNQ